MQSNRSKGERKEEYKSKRGAREIKGQARERNVCERAREKCAVGDKLWTFQEGRANRRELGVFPTASLSGPVW